MAGQMMGTFIGYSRLSPVAVDAFGKIKESSYILQVAEKLFKLLKEE